MCTILFLAFCLGANPPAAVAAPPCPYPDAVAIDGASFDGTDLLQACRSLDAEDIDVSAGATVGVQAGGAVTLGYGTRIDTQSAIEVNVAAPNLSAITVSADTVRALDRVYLSNLPAELQSVGAGAMALEVRYVLAPQAAGIPVLEDETGVYFNAPFYINDPTVGGIVDVFIAAGSARSPVITLNISPLPDSPGAMMRVVDRLQAQLQAAAGLLGIDPQSVRTATSGAIRQNPLLAPLKYADALLDDGGRATSLRGVLQPGSDFLGAKERQFLDQLAGYMRLDELAQAYIEIWADELSSGGALFPVPVGAPSLPQPTSASASAVPLPIAARAGGGCLENPLPDQLTAAQLSRFMTLATESAIKSSAGKAALLNFSGAAVGVSGSALAAAGVVSAPVAATAGAVVGASFAAHLAINSAVAGIYPRLFTDLKVQLSKNRFNLDYEEPGRYSRLDVTAVSTGWIADGALFDVVTSALGFGAIKGAKAATQYLDVIDDAFKASEIALASSAFGLQEEGLLEVCPDQWTVDVSDAEWSSVQSVDGRFSVAPVAKTFEPRVAENGVLTFFPKPFKFGFQSFQYPLEEVVGVDDMQVSALPDSVKVTPGDEVTIAAGVEAADDRRLDWSPGLGSWKDGNRETDVAGTLSKTLITPVDPSAYPFDVVITSLSDRKLSSPTAKIDDKVTIFAESLNVTPGYACLDSGQVRGFEARDDENELVDVTWTLEGPGSLSPAGLGVASYQAPAIGTGSSLKAFIVATSKGPGGLTGRAEVDVGACTCEWESNVGGVVDAGKYSSHSFNFFEVTLDFQRGGVDFANSVFNAFLSPGQTGTIDLQGMVLQIAAGPSQICTASNDSTDPENPVSVILNVIENTGRVMRGTVSGNCALGEIGSPFITGFSPYVITFRSNNRAILQGGGSICYAPP